MEANKFLSLTINVNMSSLSIVFIFILSLILFGVFLYQMNWLRGTDEASMTARRSRELALSVFLWSAALFVNKFSSELSTLIRSYRPSHPLQEPLKDEQEFGASERISPTTPPLKEGNSELVEFQTKSKADEKLIERHSMSRHAVTTQSNGMGELNHLSPASPSSRCTKKRNDSIVTFEKSGRGDGQTENKPDSIEFVVEGLLDLNRVTTKGHASSEALLPRHSSEEVGLVRLIGSSPRRRCDEKSEKNSCVRDEIRSFGDSDLEGLKSLKYMEHERQSRGSAESSEEIQNFNSEREGNENQETMNVNNLISKCSDPHPDDQPRKDPHSRMGMKLQSMWLHELTMDEDWLRYPQPRGSSDFEVIYVISMEDVTRLFNGWQWNRARQEGKIGQKGVSWMVRKSCGGVLVCPQDGCRSLARPYAKKPGRKNELGKAGRRYNEKEWRKKCPLCSEKGVEDCYFKLQTCGSSIKVQSIQSCKELVDYYDECPEGVVITLLGRHDHEKPPSVRVTAHEFNENYIKEAERGLGGERPREKARRLGFAHSHPPTNRKRAYNARKRAAPTIEKIMSAFPDCIAPGGYTCEPGQEKGRVEELMLLCDTFQRKQFSRTPGQGVTFDSTYNVASQGDYKLSMFLVSSAAMEFHFFPIFSAIHNSLTEKSYRSVFRSFFTVFGLPAQDKYGGFTFDFADAILNGYLFAYFEKLSIISREEEVDLSKDFLMTHILDATAHIRLCRHHFMKGLNRLLQNQGRSMSGQEELIRLGKRLYTIAESDGMNSSSFRKAQDELLGALSSLRHSIEWRKWWIEGRGGLRWRCLFDVGPNTTRSKLHPTTNGSESQNKVMKEFEGLSKGFPEDPIMKVLEAQRLKESEYVSIAKGYRPFRARRKRHERDLPIDEQLSGKRPKRPKIRFGVLHDQQQERPPPKIDGTVCPSPERERPSKKSSINHDGGKAELSGALWEWRGNSCAYDAYLLSLCGLYPFFCHHIDPSLTQSRRKLIDEKRDMRITRSQSRSPQILAKQVLGMLEAVRTIWLQEEADAGETIKSLSEIRDRFRNLTISIINHPGHQGESSVAQEQLEVGQVTDVLKVHDAITPGVRGILGGIEPVITVDMSSLVLGFFRGENPHVSQPVEGNLLNHLVDEYSQRWIIGCGILENDIKLLVLSFGGIGEPIGKELHKCLREIEVPMKLYLRHSGVKLTFLAGILYGNGHFTTILAEECGSETRFYLGDPLKTQKLQKKRSLSLPRKKISDAIFPRFLTKTFGLSFENRSNSKPCCLFYVLDGSNE